MQHARELLDEMSELVYICDPQTYELLYINSAGRKTFGVQELCGQKCYQILQGLDEPCSFCTNSRLNREAFYTWEFTNLKTGRHYILKDKLVEFQDREARIEIAFDLTEKVNERLRLKNSLDAENVTLECVKMLHSSSDVRKTLGAVLEKVGLFLEAERAYLFEIHGDVMDNTLEWCAPGVQPEIDRLQGLDLSLLDRWRPYFDRHQCMVIKDLETIRDISPEEYKTLKAQNISCLVTEPLELDGELAAYIGLDNPPEEKIENISSLLDTLGYFIESSLRREKDRQLLERLSYYDTLTGMLNRNAFMRDIRPGAHPSARDVGVVYLDINGMKEINDRRGHIYGDSYLARAAGQIRSLFPNDSIYRVGGDEFIILCRFPEEAFLCKVRELKQLFSGRGECSASVGYQWTASCGDIQKLIFAADEIMYTDKRDYYRGRSSSRRYRHGNDDVLGLTKPGELKKRLEEGRFRVCFQPKISMPDGKLIGAEALIRYLDTAGREIPPDQFIPVLEEARMIAQVDFFAFEQTCGMLARWMREGRGLTPVSVNFSRYSLAERDFTAHLCRLRDAYGVPSCYLKIEVTESVEEEDHYAFLDVVEDLRRQGFPVSIDDFGVKHANLSLFTSCDFDELKLDRSLVNGLENNVKAQAIIQSIVDICRRMDIQLIAEGVETQEQADTLLKLGCASAQGFLYSRPVPVEEFEQAFCRAAN